MLEFPFHLCDVIRFLVSIFHCTRMITLQNNRQREWNKNTKLENLVTKNIIKLLQFRGNNTATKNRTILVVLCNVFQIIMGVHRKRLILYSTMISLNRCPLLSTQTSYRILWQYSSSILPFHSQTSASWSKKWFVLIWLYFKEYRIVIWY